MDISSGGSFPSNKLSNFAVHPFVFRGVECAGMEGLLQSFKFENPEIQKEVCKLVGKAAKFRGKKKNWYRTQTLYWDGVKYHRDSDGYQRLLDSAYLSMFLQNEGFRNALRASGNAVFCHSMGKRKTNETVLTTSEFCGRLHKLRDLLDKENDCWAIAAAFGQL